MQTIYISIMQSIDKPFIVIIRVMSEASKILHL